MSDNQETPEYVEEFDTFDEFDEDDFGEPDYGDDYAVDADEVDWEELERAYGVTPEGHLEEALPTVAIVGTSHWWLGSPRERHPRCYRTAG